MVELIQNKINYRLNQPMVAKSKKVKVKSQRRSKTHQNAGLYQAKVPHASRIPGPACGGPRYSPIKGPITRWRAGSCKLGTKLEAGQRKFNINLTKLKAAKF